MKIKIIFFIFFFSNYYCFGQDLFNAKTLRVWEATGDTDTIVYKLKKNNKGEISYLEQSCMEIVQDTVFETFETYKKGKIWTLFRYREVLKKRKKNGDIYKYLADGPQYQFDDEGKIIFYNEYKLGEHMEFSRAYIYYPNGNLKFIAEFKNEDLWNILIYKFPTGEVYEFGDFKDGSGIINHLDDEGFPCLECKTENFQTTGKIMCDDEK